MASKSRRNTVDSVDEGSMELSQDGVKTRSKNFTQNEVDVLLSACDKFHEIINKNSNRDKDKVAKTNAWQKIKTGFDNYCKAQGFYVSK